MLWGVQQKSATTRQFVTAWLLFWPTKRPCKPGTLWCNSLRSKMVMLRACQRNERLPNHRKNALKNKKSKRSLIRAWRRSFSILRFAFVYRRFFSFHDGTTTYIYIFAHHLYVASARIQHLATKARTAASKLIDKGIQHQEALLELVGLPQIKPRRILWGSHPKLGNSSHHCWWNLCLVGCLVWLPHVFDVCKFPISEDVYVSPVCIRCTLVYIYIYMYVYIYMYIYVCIYIYICKYLCIYICIYIHVYMYLFLYIYVCVFYIPLFMQPEIFAPTVSPCRYEHFHLSIYLSVCLSTYLSIYIIYIHTSIHRYNYNP